jgi:hypothetical protein
MLLHHRRVIDHNDYRHANWFQASEFEAKAKLNVICQKNMRMEPIPLRSPRGRSEGRRRISEHQPFAGRQGGQGTKPWRSCSNLRLSREFRVA